MCVLFPCMLAVNLSAGNLSFNGFLRSFMKEGDRRLSLNLLTQPLLKEGEEGKEGKEGKEEEEEEEEWEGEKEERSLSLLKKWVCP